ncbi:MAG TPA: bifunctional glutamate N-acetyltransferase/amino-acid acetyltransferase ArgJ [Chthoniobacteraceae bacterium]|nr:bifunctional glutamate N-acetyltransferase/amino-acid acetyltransferase ArgJ [Chthoniobacteraceae bacterium]
MSGDSFIELDGGVTAPRHFVAGSVFAGIKKTNLSRPDIAFVHSTLPAVGAGVFTTNRVKSAPVRVSQAYLRNEETRTIVANSGNANACTGPIGIEHAKRMAKATARALEVKERSVLVCSTGRIGVPLPIEAMETAIAGGAATLCDDREASRRAAEAIMTSDSFSKECAVELDLDGVKVRIGGIAKGAGMIDPNMATMLSFVTTDAVIDKKLLRQALVDGVDGAFNRITVDGDMSTNDTVLVLANGAAGNAPLKDNTRAFERFQDALNHVLFNLARMIVEDGEGVTRFVTIQVRGAKTREESRQAAESVANSTLAKCSWFGGDPNWGRVMAAIGYSGARIREEMIDIYYDGLIAVQNGTGAPTPAEKLKKIVSARRFTITIDLHMGDADYTVYTTDLSTRYVELNMSE